MGIFDRIKRIVRANLDGGGLSAEDVVHDSDAELRRIIDDLRRPTREQRARASQGPGASQSRQRGVAESAEERMLKSAYAVLGCSPSSSNDHVKAAYRKLMRDHHPDTMARSSVQDQERAKARSQEINKAYEIVTRHRGMK